MSSGARPLWIVIAAAACASEPPSAGAVAAAPPVEVRAMLDGEPQAGGGNLRVQTEYAASGDVDIAAPTAEGLTFTSNGSPVVESLGERTVITERYVFSGRGGHYEIAPVTVTWRPAGGGEPVTASSSPVFFDLEVEPLSAGELADLEDPDPIWRVPWLPVLSVVGLFGAGLAVAFWPRRRELELEVEIVRPEVAALRAWEAVRADPSLSDEDKARELSLIFRTYAEAVLQFEATAWTTSEIVAHLRSMAQLPEGNVPRARRMLRATDRIKYAEERPSHELIDELDADLRAFVDATKPSAWNAGGGE